MQAAQKSSEHAVELMRFIPHVQVAILPGTDHTAIMQTDLIVTMVETFLECQFQSIKPMSKSKNDLGNGST